MHTATQAPNRLRGCSEGVLPRERPIQSALGLRQRMSSTSHHRDRLYAMTDRVCVGCGIELFDPFAVPSHAPLSARSPEVDAR